MTAIRCVALLRELLFSAGNDRLLKAWDRRRGAANRGPVDVLTGHTHWVRALRPLLGERRGEADRLLSAGQEVFLWRVTQLAWGGRLCATATRGSACSRQAARPNLP